MKFDISLQSKRATYSQGVGSAQHDKGFCERLASASLTKNMTYGAFSRQQPAYSNTHALSSVFLLVVPSRFLIISSLWSISSPSCPNTLCQLACRSRRLRGARYISLLYLLLFPLLPLLDSSFFPIIWSFPHSLFSSTPPLAGRENCRAGL
jgi:hypothetical protein